MKQKSILIVSYYFPPANTPAALRVYSFARYLSENGHKVSVLCNRDGNSRADLSLDMDCSMFERVPVGNGITGTKNIDYYFQQALKSDRPLRKYYWLCKDAGIRLLARIKNTFIGNLCTPEDSWVAAAWRKARFLDGTEKYDVVISSSGPISCHLIGCGLKRNRNEIVWIADYRDPWCNNPNFAHPVWPVSCLQAYIQRQLNNFSDSLVTVSGQLMKDFFYEYESKGCLIENGYFPDEICGASNLNPDRLVITYTGTYYEKSYSCVPLFEGVRKYVTQWPVDRSAIEINFYGSNTSSIINEAKKFDLSDMVKIYPKVSRVECLEIQRASNALIFFSSTNVLYRGFYSTKLFEYLASGIPVLMVGNGEDNCAATLVEEASAGFVCGTDGDLVCSALLKIKQHKIPERKEKVIESYRRDLLAEKLRNLIERLCITETTMNGLSK